MKRFVRITIAYIAITITHINAFEANVLVRSVSPSIVEIVGGVEHAFKRFYINDSVVRDWSAYSLVSEKGGISALISDYSSEIFILDGDSAIRQGWPDHHFALQNSAYAISEEKVYAYGGYGFWTSKNILRFWDSRNGWTPILTIEDSPILMPSQNSVLIIRDSVALIFGGDATDPRNPFVRNNLKLIQKVDLRNRSVEQMEIDYLFSQDNVLVRHDSVLVFKTDGRLISVELENLNIKEILITEDIHLAISKLNGSQKYDKEFIEKLKGSFEITTKSSNITFLVIIVVVSFILVGFIELWRRKEPSTEVVVLKDSIMFGSMRIALDEVEIEILKYLVMHEPATSDKINALFSNALSVSHVNRLRNTHVKNINKQLKAVSNGKVDELISVRKSQQDSRMVEYVLTREIKYQ